MSTVELPRFSDAVVVMGVASCGKSTIGQSLASKLAVPFIEGDTLHSEENIAKMSAGIPLTDENRWPWLESVGAAMKGQGGCIASCSALKKSYREAIAKAAERPVKFVHLHGSHAVLSQRIANRKGHFMPPSLLASQMDTLELPSSPESAITIDIDQPQDAILARSIAFLQSGE